MGLLDFIKVNNKPLDQLLEEYEYFSLAKNGEVWSDKILNKHIDPNTPNTIFELGTGTNVCDKLIGARFPMLVFSRFTFPWIFFCRFVSRADPILRSYSIRGRLLLKVVFIRTVFDFGSSKLVVGWVAECLERLLFPYFVRLCAEQGKQGCAIRRSHDVFDHI